MIRAGWSGVLRWRVSAALSTAGGRPPRPPPSQASRPAPFTPRPGPAPAGTGNSGAGIGAGHSGAPRPFKPATNGSRPPFRPQGGSYRPQGGSYRPSGPPRPSTAPARPMSAKMKAEAAKEAIADEARRVRRAAATLVDDGVDDAWRVLDARDNEQEDESDGEQVEAQPVKTVVQPKHTQSPPPQQPRASNQHSQPAPPPGSSASPAAPAGSKRAFTPVRNDEISASEVLLVLDDGTRRGIVPLAEALEIARGKGMDLVQVSANPVVCRVMPLPGSAPPKAAASSDSDSDDDSDDDSDEEDTRGNRANKKKKDPSQVRKRIQLKIAVAPHDLDTKLKKATGFLEQGYKVQVDVLKRFAHRHLTDADYVKFIKGVTDRLSSVSIIEREPRLNGNTYGFLLAKRPGAPKDTTKP